jgi:hypothetical protein
VTVRSSLIRAVVIDVSLVLRALDVDSCPCPILSACSGDASFSWCQASLVLSQHSFVAPFLLRCLLLFLVFVSYWTNRDSLVASWSGAGWTFRSTPCTDIGLQRCCPVKIYIERDSNASCIRLSCFNCSIDHSSKFTTPPRNSNNLLASTNASMHMRTRPCSIKLCPHFGYCMLVVLPDTVQFS